MKEIKDVTNVLLFEKQRKRSESLWDSQILKVVSFQVQINH